MGAFDAVLDFLWPPRAANSRGLLEVREAYGARPIQSQLNRPTWPKHNTQAYTDEAYAKLALIFRCVGILSQAVASAPLRVYPVGEDDPVDHHPLRQLLVQPNRESNEARFLSQVTLTMAVAGFCVVEKERSANGRVVGLWPINPAYCKPILRSDALPDWEIRVPGYEPVVLYSSDVIALTFADRPDMVATGIGPVEVILREVALLNIQTDFLKSFFDQGAMPQYALIPNPEVGELTQAQADIIKEKWRQRYGGLLRSADPAILAGISDVRRLSFDFDELAFTDLRDLSDLAITQAFGIPPILAGTHFGLERSTFANYGEARRSFYEDTVSPLWNRIEDAVGRSLLGEFAANRQQWRLNFDASDVPAMRDDVLPRQTLAVQAFQAGGLSSHQLADELGIEPRGPDVFLRTIASMDLPAVTVRAQRSVRVTEQRALLALPETRQRIGIINRTAYLRVAERFAPQVQDFFDGQADRAMAVLGLRSQNGVERRDIADLIDWDAEDRLLGELLRALTMANGQVAFQLAGQAFGDDAIVWTVNNPRIAQLLDQLATRVVGINATTRADISRIVTEGLLDGVSMPELAGRLTGLFEVTYANRATTIARTESMNAFNQSAVLAYKESGVVEMAQLLDNPDHTEIYDPNCLSCADRDGLIVPLDEVQTHIDCEHVNGTMAVTPYLTPIGEE